MLPLIGFVNILARAITAAITAYEIYQFGHDLYDKTTKYGEIIENAKKKLKPALRKMQQELNSNTALGGEKALINAQVNKDKGGNVSPNKTGRFEKNYEIYIKEKIPYRELISQICEMANENGFPELRAKRGAKLKVTDLPKSKAEILAKWMGVLITEITDKELDDLFIVARLKQFAASLMFEYTDDILYWKSPLKSEVSFGPNYKDPIYDANIPLKLKREGGDTNPFYPSPYHNGKGSFTADLVIPETRLAEISKTNIFAIIEIKFPGDRPGSQQMQLYSNYLALSKKAKQAKYGSQNSLNKTSMIHGGKLALFRYPEDTPNYQHQKTQQKKSGGNR